MSAYTPEIYRRLATPLRLDLGSTATTVENTKTVVDQIKADTALVAGVATQANAIVNKVDAMTAQAIAIDHRLISTRVDLITARQTLEAKLTDAERNLHGDSNGLKTALQDSADMIVNKVDATAAQAFAIDQRLIGTRLDLITAHQALETKLTDAAKNLHDDSLALQATIKTTADDIVERVIAGVHPVAPSVNDKSAPLVRLLIQAQAVALDETPEQRFPNNDKHFPGELKDDGAIVTLGARAAKLYGQLANAPDLQARFRLAFEKFSSTSLRDRAKRFADMHALVDEIAAFLNDD